MIESINLKNLLRLIEKFNKKRGKYLFLVLYPEGNILLTEMIEDIYVHEEYEFENIEQLIKFLRKEIKT